MRGEQLDRAFAEVVGRACRGTGRPRGSARDPARRCTRPARVDHGVADTVAAAPDAASTAPRRYVYTSTASNRAAPSHRAQVQRRAVGDVDEPRRPDGQTFASASASRRLSTGIPAPAPPARRIGGRPAPRPLRMLERGRGGQDQDLVTTARARAAPRRTPEHGVRPFVATDEGDGRRRGSVTRGIPCSRSGSYERRRRGALPSGTRR